MKIEFKADLSGQLDHEGVQVWLYLTDDQNEPFEFFLPYDEMLDSIIEMHIIPSTNKMSREGFDEIKLLSTKLREQADKIDEAATYFEPMENQNDPQ